MPSRLFAHSQSDSECWKYFEPGAIEHIFIFPRTETVLKLSHYLAEAYQRWGTFLCLVELNYHLGKFHVKISGWTGKGQEENPGCLDDCSSRFDVM